LSRIFIYSFLYGIFFCISCSNNNPVSIEETFKRHNQLREIAELMDDQLYDSALRLSILEEISMSYEVSNQNNYLLKSYQSEILYYNSLFELGFEKANEALIIAEKFFNNDSALISNAYNLMGINAEHFMAYEKVKEYYEQAWSNIPDSMSLFYSQKWHISSNLGQLLINYGHYEDGKKWIQKSNVLCLSNDQFRTLAINYATLLESMIAEQDITGYQPIVDSLDKYINIAEHKDLVLFGLETKIRLGFFQKSNSSAFDLIDEAEKFISANDNRLTEFSKFSFYNKVGNILKLKGYANLAFEFKIKEQQIQLNYQEAAFSMRQNIIQDFYKGIEQLLRAENKALDAIVNLELARKQNFQTILIYSLILLILLIVLLLVFAKYKSDKQKLINENLQIGYQKEIEKVEDRIEAILQERKRLKMEFHDGIVPNLSSWKLIMEAEIKKYQFDGMINTMPELIDQTITDLRNLIDEDLPDLLIKKGLYEAISRFIHITKTSRPWIDFAFESNIQKDRFAKLIEFNVLRITQECIHNAIKHTNSPIIETKLHLIGNQLFLSIKDYGTNSFINLDGEASGSGLKNINKRADVINSKITIYSEKGSGTQINLTIPI
jgi:signal transduction histidine kinase